MMSFCMASVPWEAIEMTVFLPLDSRANLAVLPAGPIAVCPFAALTKGLTRIEDTALVPQP